MLGKDEILFERLWRLPKELTLHPAPIPGERILCKIMPNDRIESSLSSLEVCESKN